MTKKNIIDKGRYGLYFIIPYFVAYLVFSVYPIIYSFVISFEKWDGMSPTATFVGLTNYTNLLNDPIFYQSILNTFIMEGFCIVPQMLVALFLAVLFNNWRVRGKEFFRAIFYLPNLITPAAVAVLFSFIFDWQSGAINMIFAKFHFISEPINWFFNTGSARGIISLVLWWMWFGYSMIIFGAGLKNIPMELYEAASIDGASAWRQFTSITMPLLRPTILYSCVTSLIGGLQIFDIPFVMTSFPGGPGIGGPSNTTMTMVMYLYYTAFLNMNYGYGAAIGYGLFILTLILSLVTFRIINRKAQYA
jgi:multiple sugar transport system permease protein